MSQAEPQRKRWRIIQTECGENWPIFTGDFDYVNEVLSEKSSKSAWLLLQYLNAVTRSFGQVIFANNPVSGFIIIIAIAIADYKALLAAMFTSTLSFAFALIFKQDSAAILNGAYGFNAVLLGIVSVATLPGIHPEIEVSSPRFWIYLTVATVMSVYFTSALSGLLRHIGQNPVPSFTLPFNLIEYMLIFCLLHSMPATKVGNHLIQLPGEGLEINGTFGGINNTKAEMDLLTVVESNNGSGLGVADHNDMEHLDWGEIFSGTIVALSQVYGLNNVPCAALMYLALFVYSPLMTGFAYLGSLCGTLIGITFSTSPLHIYHGLWGYNGLLSAAALGGFCFVLNVQTTMLAITSIVFTTVLQHVMQQLVSTAICPVFTMPFNIATILFLFITTEKEESLQRPTSLTFPEQHRQEYKKISADRPMQGYLRRTSMSVEREII